MNRGITLKQIQALPFKDNIGRMKEIAGNRKDQQND